MNARELDRFAGAECQIEENPKLALSCDRFGHVIKTKQTKRPSKALRRLAHIAAWVFFLVLSGVVTVTLLDEVLRVFQATTPEQLNDSASKAFAALVFGVGWIVVLIK